MKIVIFGPQGSGKGTQAELIARRHNWPYISTGDIFRYNIKNETTLGKQANEFISKGHLVPDEVTNAIVKDRIQQPDCSVGFVLDGYPRTESQAQFLHTITDIDIAIVIDISDAIAMERLSQRLACKCGLSYHLTHNPPQKTGICDRCGNELFRRDDDNPDAIKERLSIYHAQTEPVFAVYRAQGKLYHVDGSVAIEEVYTQIDTIIQENL